MTGAEAGPSRWRDGTDPVPAAAWVASLAGLPEMGPVRLRALLTAWPADEAWRRVRAGGLERVAHVAGACRGLTAEVAARWAATARGIDVVERWQEHLARGVIVLTAEDPAWPAVLADDPEPPVVLFVRGDLAALDRPAVAIIGTRRATPTGRVVARELGSDLAAAGVHVLSGLALGIDGAAHVGALAAEGAPPVAVVGTGLDVTYPRAHAGLTERVAGVGAVVSEYPLGTPPAAWRFPARNRILAALAQAVVVVESPAKGGSMHTVDAALDRDRTVLAVPGSVRNPAAAGTNGLLAAGCPPARDATDILVALGLETSGTAASRSPAAPAPEITGAQRTVLEGLGWDATSLEQLADRLRAPLGVASLHLAELERLGAVVRTGAWYTRIAR